MTIDPLQRLRRPNITARDNKPASCKLLESTLLCEWDDLICALYMTLHVLVNDSLSNESNRAFFVLPQRVITHSSPLFWLKEHARYKEISAPGRDHGPEE